MFQALFEREIRRIPERFKRGVNNFFADPRALRHPGPNLGLYILGHYHTDKAGLGPCVTLYYGSFRKVYRRTTVKRIRREIVKTLAHELLHHWELQAGINPLGEEDARQLARWKQRLGLPTGVPTGRDLVEALLFLWLIFLGILAGSAFSQHLF